SGLDMGTPTEGVAESTEGHKFTWYGDGETKVAANSAFELTYGVKTEVSIGMETSVSLAAKTEISIGMAVEASLSESFKIDKESSLDISGDGDCYYIDSYTSSVGADAIQRSQIATLTKIAWASVATQAALTASYAIAAAAIKHKNPEDEHLYLPHTD